VKPPGPAPYLIAAPLLCPSSAAALSESNLIWAGAWLANSREISHRAFHLLQVAVSERQKLVIYCVAGTAAAPGSPGFEAGSYCVLQCTNTEQVVWLQRASIHGEEPAGLVAGIVKYAFLRSGGKKIQRKMK